VYEYTIYTKEPRIVAKEARIVVKELQVAIAGRYSSFARIRGSCAESPGIPSRRSLVVSTPGYTGPVCARLSERGGERERIRNILGHQTPD